MLNWNCQFTRGATVHKITDTALVNEKKKLRVPMT